MTATDGEALVRVLLVDDQELVRSGLRRILRRRDGIEVVGECEDGDQVPAAVAAHAPDVVVMDLRMRRVDGITATRELAADPEAPPVLVLTTFDDDELLSSRKYLTAPNLFTLVRLCCIPVFLYLLFPRDNVPGAALLLGSHPFGERQCLGLPAPPEHHGRAFVGRLGQLHRIVGELIGLDHAAEHPVELLRLSVASGLVAEQLDATQPPALLRSDVLASDAIQRPLQPTGQQEVIGVHGEQRLLVDDPLVNPIRERQRHAARLLGLGVGVEGPAIEPVEPGLLPARRCADRPRANQRERR